MIDWDRVLELREEVGADDFDEVAELFLEEADEVIARLKSKDGRENLEDDLHFLKGSALNLGFRAMAILCQSGEKAASEGNGQSFDLAALFETYEQSRSVFEKKQAELAA